MSLENKIFETHWSMWFIIYTHSHSLQFNTRCLYAVIISLSTQLNVLYGHRNYHFLGWKQQIWRSGRWWDFQASAASNSLHPPASTSGGWDSKHKPRASHARWPFCQLSCIPHRVHINWEAKAQLCKLVLARDAVGWKSSGPLYLCGAGGELLDHRLGKASLLVCDGHE